MNNKQNRYLLKTIRRDIAASAGKGQEDGEPQGNSGRSSEIREWITIGGLFVAAGISAFQLFEMRKVYEPVVSQARSAEEQVKAAMRSVELAQQAFEVAQRPWLSPQLSIADDLIMSQDGFRLNIRYSIKNNGNAVATVVQRELGIATVFASREEVAASRTGPQKGWDVLPEAKRRCTTADPLNEILDTAGAFAGDAIFPAEAVEGIHQFTGRSDSIPQARAGDLSLYSAIYVCVRYRSPFDRKFHKTFVSYAIKDLKGRAGQPEGGLDPTPGTIPVSSLRFDRVGDAYAD